ncbi:TetR-like C-terminal domain-containing protein [Roseibium sediminicola]|uniref:TetR/AcrR family transcriptional regulator C-terminal ligand-binding domain-containing protein n=1 Tax=Roseibium sediminicola TaxID=2933272 RepID=A0ABT0H0W6_9HYPH|nr:TetR-like C-terminal domain-containing protein [Roseibium sp. CAU 1639]MCK7614710.1 TetR/AcrR family transcriptional regulator C-terminal ligand-binding domain-containing protein [Roseibium sp. CAU 1639]
MAEAGRPRQARVTGALLAATLSELAENGYEKTTIAAIAARARTSKQAVYRRYADKEALIAAAVEQALVTANPGPPQRGSVAEDLRLCLLNSVKALQETPLGGAIRALVPYRQRPGLAAVLAEAEEGRRLVLRQIFLATPFEADMETRIDLLLGLIYFRLLIRGQDVTEGDIETAIYLVLGLVAPRDPAAFQGLPGM